jgi:hypothetical protein
VNSTSPVAPTDAARASEALVDALREAHELARAGEFGKPLADVLWFCDDMLDVMAEYVERPNAGEGERGAFMEMRERVAALRAQVEGSPGEPGHA